MQYATTTAAPREALTEARVREIIREELAGGSAWAEEQSAERIRQLEEAAEVARSLLAERDARIATLEEAIAGLLQSRPLGDVFCETDPTAASLAEAWDYLTALYDRAVAGWERVTAKLADRDARIATLEGDLAAAQETGAELAGALSGEATKIARLEGEAAAKDTQITSLKRQVRASETREAIAKAAATELRAEIDRIKAPPLAELSIDGRLVRRLHGEGPSLDAVELRSLGEALTAATQALRDKITEIKADVPLGELSAAIHAGAATPIVVTDQVEPDHADAVVTQVSGERVARREWLIQIAREVLHRHGLGEGATILRRAAAALRADYPPHTPVHPEGWATVVARARQLERGAA